MFKKLMSHDKTKAKSAEPPKQAQVQNRKPEKETTQHIENSTDVGLQDDSISHPPVIEEDPQDLLPITEDPNLPFGDGANKIFGMENFGNTCYCNSILQVLYYTTSFRSAVLQFPERDPDHLRKRRLNVPGDKQHAFAQAQLTQADKSTLLESVNEEESSKSEKKKTSLFGKSKNNKSHTGSNGSSIYSPSTSGSTSTVATNGVSANGSSNLLPDINPQLGAAGNPHLIDKDVANKYPALKTIKPVYQLNQQRTVSILGDTEDATANSEKRKRFALIQGPIINLDHAFNETYGMDNNLFAALKDIFECMVENKSQTGIMSPQNLIEVLKHENELFRSSMHQDAHEFLNFLINSVLEVVDNYQVSSNGSQDIKQRQSSSTSLDDEKRAIHEIFEGLLTSETKCLCCERTSTRDEKFLDLSIDLTPSSSITNCLKQFSQSEMLQEQNKFYCDSCHSLQEAAKTIRLKKSPKILALHLKRFKYSEELNRNMKLFHRVTYPKNLRLFNTTTDTETPDKLYQLYAVVVHIGGGPHHGHYVSLIKTENFGWLLFDDESVESIDENYVFKFFGDGPGLATAYVLFYKEIDEYTNLENNLFNGFDEEQDDDTLDVSLNQENGMLQEKLGSLHVTPDDSVIDLKESKGSSGNSSAIELGVGHGPMRNVSNGEKRMSKMFGWKKKE